MKTTPLLARAILLLSLTGLAQAQPASAPAPSPAPAAAAAPAAAPAADASEGKLAWYGRKFAGRKTASGQRFNPEAMTMAHKTLPFGTQVRVTNLKNQRSVVLRVNDRGPTQADRIGDVSQAAARRLGMLRAGVIDARIEVLAPAKR
ncbi:MAG: septal ring lytic transglycosylase RlpA family protein [Rubrivivax sp.]|jgi:rare lipoprotein A|nr:septal ring lytic transglycosylase RlpA family protein [Rubrivivax sp.]